MSADRAIRASTAAVVLAVACVAAYVSYRHAYELVRTHGEDAATARLVPLTVDGLVYASSMVMLYAARHRLAVPPLARVLLGLGIAATLAANVAHGAGHGTVGAVIAAWPAVALVGSYELCMWIVRTGRTRPAPGARRTRARTRHRSVAGTGSRGVRRAARRRTRPERPSDPSDIPRWPTKSTAGTSVPVGADRPYELVRQWYDADQS